MVMVLVVLVVVLVVLVVVVEDGIGGGGGCGGGSSSASDALRVVCVSGMLVRVWRACPCLTLRFCYTSSSSSSAAAATTSATGIRETDNTDTLAQSTTAGGAQRRQGEECR